MGPRPPSRPRVLLDLASVAFSLALHAAILGAMASLPAGWLAEASRPAEAVAVTLAEATDAPPATWTANLPLPDPVVAIEDAGWRDPAPVLVEPPPESVDPPIPEADRDGDVEVLLTPPDLEDLAAQAGAMCRAAPPARAEEAGDRRADGSARLLVPPRPVYPDACRRAGQQGLVVVSIRVEADGRAGLVEVAEACPFEPLNLAALRAASRARFLPACRAGVPVPSTARIPIRFILD